MKIDQRVKNEVYISNGSSEWHYKIKYMAFKEYFDCNLLGNASMWVFQLSTKKFFFTFLLFSWS